MSEHKSSPALKCKVLSWHEIQEEDDGLWGCRYPKQQGHFQLLQHPKAEWWGTRKIKAFTRNNGHRGGNCPPNEKTENESEGGGRGKSGPS